MDKEKRIMPFEHLVPGRKPEHYQAYLRSRIEYASRVAKLLGEGYEKCPGDIVTFDCWHMEKDSDATFSTFVDVDAVHGENRVDVGIHIQSQNVIGAIHTTLRVEADGTYFEAHISENGVEVEDVLCLVDNVGRAVNSYFAERQRQFSNAFAEASRRFSCGFGSNL